MQRRAILETILVLDNHPTADEVCVRVVDRIPGLSRSTVHRTLATLVRLGDVIKSCHPGCVVRHDPRTEIHHHLICVQCDAVIDIDDDRLDALPIPDTSTLGFEASDFRVQLRGTCRRCRQREGTR